MGLDRFGNPHAPNLSYARGKIICGTEDDFRKLQRAWSLIRERGLDEIYVFTGLEHSLPLAAEELAFADDEIAPALSFGRLKALALEHLGGSPDTDDVAVFNRLTAATMATHLTLVKPGDVVIGVSASHSHPSVVRAAGHVGGQFIDTAGLGAFAEDARARGRYRCDRSRQIRHEGPAPGPTRRQEGFGQPNPSERLRVRHGSASNALPGRGADA